MSISTLNWSNITTPTQVLQAANDNSGGAFWPTSFFMFILILFLSMLGFGAEVAGIVALFIGMMVGIILLYLGLIPTMVAAVPAGILFFMLIYIIYSSSKTQ